MVATLIPGTGRVRGFGVCLYCDARATADGLLNLLLFLPLGLALAHRYRRPWWILAIGPLLSLAVELAQTHLPGRDPGISDIISNSLGAALGILLYRSRGPGLSWWRRHRRLSAFLPAVLGLLVLGGGAALLAPAIPRGPYWVRWGTSTDVAVPFEGSVSASRIGDLRIWPGDIRERGRFRRALLAGVPLEVDARVDSVPDGLAGILGISEHEREVATLGLDRRAAIFRLRTRAAGLRLTQTGVSLPHALDGRAPLNVRIRGWRSGRGYCIDSGARRDCGLGYTLGDGWRVVIGPDRLAPWWRAVLAGVWIVGLLALGGFVLERALDRLVLSAAAVAIALFLPGMAGILPTPGWQVLAALLGPWLGGLMRLRVPGRRAARQIEG